MFDYKFTQNEDGTFNYRHVKKTKINPVYNDKPHFALIAEIEREWMDNWGSLVLDGFIGDLQEIIEDEQEG